MVKQFMNAAARPAQEQSRLPILEKDMPQPLVQSLGRILPTDEESSDNPRARSAVLRVVQRTETPIPQDWMRSASERLLQQAAYSRQPAGKRGRR